MGALLDALLQVTVRGSQLGCHLVESLGQQAQLILACHRDGCFQLPSAESLCAGAQLSNRAGNAALEDKGAYQHQQEHHREVNDQDIQAALAVLQGLGTAGGDGGLALVDHKINLLPKARLGAVSVVEQNGQIALTVFQACALHIADQRIIARQPDQHPLDLNLLPRGFQQAIGLF